MWVSRCVFCCRISVAKQNKAQSKAYLLTNTQSKHDCDEARTRIAPSALVGYLVELWSWGRLSPQTLRIIVDKAKQDILAYAAGTLDFTEIEQLSTIGAEGHATQNALRDLERKLSVPRLDKARFSFNCLMRSPMARFVLQDNMQDVVLPHHFFHILHRDYPDEFQTKFVGHPGGLSDCWLDQAGNPLLDDHPLMSRANWQTTTIPFAIHGDATPVAGIGKGWGKQVDIYSFYSLVAHGTTRDLMVLLYAGFVHLLTKDSMLQVWRILVWSFKALAKGCWPETDAYGTAPTNATDKDRAGTPLAGEYAAVVWCIESDLDYYSKNLGAATLVVRPPLLLVPRQQDGGRRHVLERISRWSCRVARGILDKFRMEGGPSRGASLAVVAWSWYTKCVCRLVSFKTFGLWQAKLWFSALLVMLRSAAWRSCYKSGRYLG